MIAACKPVRPGSIFAVRLLTRLAQALTHSFVAEVGLGLRHVGHGQPHRDQPRIIHATHHALRHEARTLAILRRGVERGAPGIKVAHPLQHGRAEHRQGACRHIRKVGIVACLDQGRLIEA